MNEHDCGKHIGEVIACLECYANDRRKLELWDAMLALLKDARNCITPGNYEAGDIHTQLDQVLAKVDKLVSK